jgi:hypothetical protein
MNQYLQNLQEMLTYTKRSLNSKNRNFEHQNVDNNKTKLECTGINNNLLLFLLFTKITQLLICQVNGPDRAVRIVFNYPSKFILTSLTNPQTLETLH